jgi:hypothetical protein
LLSAERALATPILFAFVLTDAPVQGARTIGIYVLLTIPAAIFRLI